MLAAGAPRSRRRRRSDPDKINAKVPGHALVAPMLRVGADIPLEVRLRNARRNVEHDLGGAAGFRCRNGRESLTHLPVEPRHVLVAEEVANSAPGIRRRQQASANARLATSLARLPSGPSLALARSRDQTNSVAIHPSRNKP